MAGSDRLKVYLSKLSALGTGKQLYMCFIISAVLLRL